MREQSFAAFAGKLRGYRRRGLLGERARFAQQLDRVTQPRVERGEFHVGSHQRLQGRGFFG